MLKQRQQERKVRVSATSAHFFATDFLNRLIFLFRSFFLGRRGVKVLKFVRAFYTRKGRHEGLSSFKPTRAPF